jgi:HEAT repeat protein
MNGEIALYGAESLERLGIPRKEIIEELIVILKSGDEKMQIYAAKALGNIGKSSKAAIKALVEEFTKKRIVKINEDLECAIVYSFGKIGDIKEKTFINSYLKKYKKYIETGSINKIRYLT